MRRIAAVGLLLALAACTGSESGDAAGDPKAAPGFAVPQGISLSDPGTERKLGQSLTVGYPAADDEAGTALALGVTTVAKAPKRHLSLYRVPAGMQPYYVRVMVGNRGPAAASFPAGVPWWLHVAGDVLVPPTAAPRGLARCVPPRVGKALPAGSTVKGCLLFFVPRGTAVESVDFQPAGVETAVRWRR
jgi:hypothetical protein